MCSPLLKFVGTFEHNLSALMWEKNEIKFTLFKMTVP